MQIVGEKGGGGFKTTCQTSHIPLSFHFPSILQFLFCQKQAKKKKKLNSHLKVRFRGQTQYGGLWEFTAWLTHNLFSNLAMLSEEMGSSRAVENPL